MLVRGVSLSHHLRLSARNINAPGAAILRRSLFINTESTPNPQSYKFLPGREVLPEIHGTGIHFSISDKKEILSRSPLVKKLFADVKGIKSVFLGRDFLTITKNADESWPRLKPIIFATMLDFFADNTPVYLNEDENAGNAVTDTTILESDGEVVAAIKELIETRVRPSVQEDGGDIFYVGFNEKTGIVQVRLAGSCVGCPSSSVTLRNGVENMLMHYIPEVKGIEEVTQASGGEGGDSCDSEFNSTQERLKLQFKPDFTPPPKENKN
jgi:Fe-S cluster biogenesis protein NfuA